MLNQPHVGKHQIFYNFGSAIQLKIIQILLIKGFQTFIFTLEGGCKIFKINKNLLPLKWFIHVKYYTFKHDFESYNYPLDYINHTENVNKIVLQVIFHS